MDPTTAGHLDANTLSHTPASDPSGIPSLNVKSSAEIKAQQERTGSSTSTTTDPAATGLRQRVNKLGAQLDHASEHPAVKNAKEAAGKQVGQFREFLGNFPVVKDIETRTGVDRLILVVGGLFGYLFLVPLNIFGLALPVTQMLTFVPPAYLALGILDRPGSAAGDEETKTLLSYFVVLGLIQFTESLAPGVLAKRIPQYWTLKLIFLAYLLHPQTKGALKIHEAVLSKVVRRSAAPTTTPPTSNPFKESASSPTFPASTIPPQEANVPKSSAQGENFEVISEMH